MQQESKRWSRSAEKEAFWRGHLGRQSFSGLSIRAYCRLHGLTEPLFYAWRREIARRDEAQQRVPADKGPIDVIGQRRTRSPRKQSKVAARTATGVAGLPKAGSTRAAAAAGLVAVTIVDDALPRSSPMLESRMLSSPTLEVQCAGGPTVRLREDVSLEVLRRVMMACHPLPGADTVSMIGEVRSC